MEEQLCYDLLMLGIELININPNEWTQIQGFSSKGRRVKSWYERISDGEVYLYKLKDLINVHS